MLDFLYVIEKKLGRGGYTQIFGVYSKNITASVGGGGGGLMPNFFTRNREKIRKGRGLYPNFWCILKEYYCECGGGSLYQVFYTWKGGVYTQIVSVYSKNIPGGGVGCYAKFFYV